MAIKITLGKRPDAFKAFPVKLTLPDGTEGAIQTTFKYHTRDEFGEVLNRIYEPGEKRAPGEKVDFVALGAESRGRFTKELAAGIKEWDLEFPVNAETLGQLANEYPAATNALFSAWQAACNEGRLGN